MTRMAQEIGEAPQAVAAQARVLERPLAELGARLARMDPRVVVTCARGSSAHAATFGKHLFERYLGIPVAAAAPNIATVYGRELRLKDQFFLAISQSGMSDDIVEAARTAKASGALTACIANAVASPLAAACDIILPMAAGPEVSVAATKTFITSLAALLRLTARWSKDAAMEQAVGRLPERLATAAQLEWSAPLDVLARAASLITIGRGPTLAIAREAALKLKENCNLHAEAFSGAEFVHGPVALVERGYPVLMFMPTDAAAPGMHELAATLRGKGAEVFATGTSDAAGRLAAPAADNPDTDAVCLIQTFYGMAYRLAARRGADVDRPRHLQKVTRTR
ncbi:MAG: SIS domain-containing protein [Bradyrhizobiaceae bacterium]|nr:SIS domain-containing protein [Bradyrhizobiaceae bacterium]